MENHLTFRNWREASEHAQNLLNSGQINFDEYGQILARAEIGRGMTESKDWPRYIRRKVELRATQDAIAEQKELERRYPLTRAGKVKKST
jgi:hypothetical protein